MFLATMQVTSLMPSLWIQHSMSRLHAILCQDYILRQCSGVLDNCILWHLPSLIELRAVTVWWHLWQDCMLCILMTSWEDCLRWQFDDIFDRTACYDCMLWQFDDSFDITACYDSLMTSLILLHTMTVWWHLWYYCILWQFDDSFDITAYYDSLMTSLTRLHAMTF